MTPIERFREAVESLDMDCHEIGVVAQEVGPLLLELVDAVEEWADVTELRATRSGKTLGTNILKALAKLKEEE